MDRRLFCASLFGGSALAGRALAYLPPPWRSWVSGVDKDWVTAAALRYLAEHPQTVTSVSSSRSPGGPHDYYSEADYWWPDPATPDGRPYLRKDGLSNPDKFVGHRNALIHLSVQVGALAAAFRMAGDRRFADRAAEHLRAWFVTPATRMAPHLEHAQAILGRDTGRGIGVIDTLHLVEVARAVSVLEASHGLPAADATAIKAWFADYLRWMTTSKNGVDEREQENNHGSCWVLQVAEFARLTGDRTILAYARERFRTVLIPTQIAADGRQPLELSRTKPYSYCLFNLDVLATCAWVLGGADLWTVEGSPGGSLTDAINWMTPFILDKTRWPYPPDVEYFDDLPVRHVSLFFGGIALDRPDLRVAWTTLDPQPAVDEIIRNFPIRQPILWLA